MRLKAPEGCGSVSWGGQSYPVVKGVVDVPDEARELLEPGWGFTPAPVESEAPSQKTENRKPKTGT